MGAEINRYTVSLGASYTINSVKYSGIKGILVLSVNDSDPLHQVDLHIIAQADVQRTSGTSQTIPAGILTASVSGTFSGSASNSERTIINITTIKTQKLVGTYYRNFDTTTLPCRLTIQLSNKTPANQDFALQLPPFKQNATYNNHRITYTSGGVKYDLLNYK